MQVYLKGADLAPLNTLKGKGLRPLIKGSGLFKGGTGRPLKGKERSQVGKKTHKTGFTEPVQRDLPEAYQSGYTRGVKREIQA